MFLVVLMSMCVIINRRKRKDASISKSIWIDNYSNIARNAHVSSAVANVRLELWSVIGMICCAPERISNQKVTRDDSGNIIPVHTKQPLPQKTLLRDSLRKVDDEGPSYLKNSIVASRNVNNVPPTPSFKSYTEGSKYHRILQLHINRLKEFVPISVLPLNPASNDGCFRLFQYIINDLNNDCDYAESQGEDFSYRIVVSDVNIYPRLLQVHFTKFDSYLLIFFYKSMICIVM